MGLSLSTTASCFESSGSVKMRRLLPLVVIGEGIDPFPTEGAAQQPGRHRGVGDDSSAVISTPIQEWQRPTVEQIQTRLQRIHVADRLTPVKQIAVEVRHADPSDLSLVN